MFSLIITIISIALAIALALAAVYYMSYSGQSAMDSAHQSMLLNQATVLQSSVALYQHDHDGALPPTGAESAALLSGNYLSAWPSAAATNWSVQNGYAVTSVDSAACQAMNTKLGITTIPSCSDPQYANQVVCCQQ